MYSEVLYTELFNIFLHTLVAISFIKHTMEYMLMKYNILHLYLVDDLEKAKTDRYSW